MTTSDEQPLRVLLCDDDVALSSALAMLIQCSRGFALVAAPVRTGRAAVDGVDLHRPDVVLMDVNLLGQMDGFQATALIKGRSPTTNVVILSGIADPNRASMNAHDAGAFSFLAKGCSPVDIIAAIGAAGQATRAMGSSTPG
jgi:two-component system, NarL family, response regulator DesR